MYVCMHVCICQKCAKKTRLCENSNNGNDLDIDGDESLFRISAVVSSAFLKIFLPYYQWRYQPILW